MRIVSGKLKGRRFSPPSCFRARPTTDMAKENLFNILVNQVDLQGIEVLDLFAGTGSLSYEFASRGAAAVTSVEKDYHHYAFIKKCTRELELSQIIKPVKADVFTYVKKAEPHSFDLIFADPPFDLATLDRIPDQILQSKLLRPEGLFILEHGPGQDFSNHQAFNQTRNYGKVRFTFFNPLQ